MRARPARLERLPEQYFTALLARVAAAAAEDGEPLVDLGRGNPDVPPPAHVVERLVETAREPTSLVHGYAPFLGLPKLKEAIAGRYRDVYGVELDPEREVAVVPGTKTALVELALVLADHGDTILLPDPGYPDYLSGVAFAGATPVPLPLDPAAAFQPDLSAAAGAEPALALLNYPSNPCATCERPGTFEAAVTFAHERGCWLVHDLAYDRLAFDGRRVRSVLAVEGAREVAAELWSPSKVYGMAGWRIGFLVGNAELVERVSALVDHATAGVWTGLQRGLEAALDGDQSLVETRRRTYERRRDLLVGRMRAAGAEIEASEGTFYVWWRLPPGLTSEALVDEHRLGVADGLGFGSRGRGWVRLSLALPDAQVDLAAERIAGVLREKIT